MPNSRLVGQIQHRGVEEALDIAERLGYGGSEAMENFGHVKHPAIDDAQKAGVLVGILAKAVEDLHQRVGELEAQSSKQASGKKKSA